MRLKHNTINRKNPGKFEKRGKISLLFVPIKRQSGENVVKVVLLSVVKEYHCFSRKVKIIIVLSNTNCGCFIVFSGVLIYVFVRNNYK